MSRAQDRNDPRLMEERTREISIQIPEDLAEEIDLIIKEHPQTTKDGILEFLIRKSMKALRHRSKRKFLDLR